MENIKYLEDALKGYGKTRNVLVQLSSAHAVYTGLTEPTYVPDCVGNHYASSWETAIAKNPSLQRKFIVELVLDNGTTRQTTIYLRAMKGDSGLQLLELESNLASVYSALSGIV